MPKKVDEVCSSVLRKVTPEEQERRRIEELAKRLKENILSASEPFNIEVDVRVEGSVAKNTWLSRDPDIDLFVQMPPTTPRKSLAEIGLKVARTATEGYKQVERYAEHPYLEAVVDETRVNIVPCYRVEQGEWLSATDRTPFHTDYIKDRLKDEMKGEVRLLKKFMKGIDAYGAEIKVGGFSGYLCELLILHFESFKNTLKNFSHYKERMVIDVEGYYKNGEVEELFQDPLIVVDPVDQSRNVASAVKTQKLSTLIAAARSFFKNPSEQFFYPRETEVLSVRRLKQELSNRGSAVIFVTFGSFNAVPDVLWGQLYKSLRALHRYLEKRGFKVLRDVAWSDEKNLNVLIFELGQRSIPAVHKRFGPPLEKKEGCEKFLQKYMDNPVTISGPYIEGRRWVVEIQRVETDVVDLLNEQLKDGGREIGIAGRASRKIGEEFKIYVDDGVTEVYRGNIDFQRFLTQFLSGKPKWLK